jgi:hypothetical protein
LEDFFLTGEIHVSQLTSNEDHSSEYKRLSQMQLTGKKNVSASAVVLAKA